MKKKEMGAFLLIVSIIFNCKISPAVCYKWPISIWKYSQFQCFWILSKSNNSNTVCQLLTLTCWPLFFDNETTSLTVFVYTKRFFLRKPFLMQVLPISMNNPFSIYIHGNHPAPNHVIAQEFSRLWLFRTHIFTVSPAGVTQQAAFNFSHKTPWLPFCLNCPFAAHPCASWIGCEWGERTAQPSPIR